MVFLFVCNIYKKSAHMGYKLNESNIIGKKMILIERDSGYISPDMSFKGKSNRQVVREFTEYEDGGNDTISLYAVLQKHGVENKNGRVYPEELLKREARNYQKLIEAGQALGESNHPETSVIDNDRVSHHITEIWWDGRTLMGKLDLHTSPGYHKFGIISCVGDKIADMIRRGVQIGISSRGVGSLEQEHGKNIVQDDFELICWDIVTSPSTPGSYISTNAEQLRPYMENEEKKGEVISENDNELVNKLNKFLKS